MTRKHYRQVADIIRHHAEVYEMDEKTLASVAESLATIFRADNPRFSFDKFYEACGMNANMEWFVR